LKAREARDREIDVFVAKQEVAIQRLEERLHRTEIDVAERESALRRRRQEEWVGLGETVLGMIGAAYYPITSHPFVARACLLLLAPVYF
jgi:hypothetical protein